MRERGWKEMYKERQRKREGRERERERERKRQDIGEKERVRFGLILL